MISNLQAVLMQDLLDDDLAPGTTRRKMVRIRDTVYLPAQMPQSLHEMLALIMQKAAQVNNPLEAAFFLWMYLACLQPFEDGNKRVSRLTAMRLDSAPEPLFEPLLRRELAQLQEHNCARYRLASTDVQSWIAAGRPVD